MIGKLLSYVTSALKLGNVRIYGVFAILALALLSGLLWYRSGAIEAQNKLQKAETINSIYATTLSTKEAQYAQLSSATATHDKTLDTIQKREIVYRTRVIHVLQATPAWSNAHIPDTVARLLRNNAHADSAP